MSDVNVLLCAVDSVMNALAAFDRDRADVTARVSFALGSVLARVVLETEQCRRALKKHITAKLDLLDRLDMLKTEGDA